MMMESDSLIDLMRPKIKICDVRTMEAARTCIDYSIDFAGIHNLKWPMTLSKQSLFHEVKKQTNRLKLVLVTKEEDPAKLFEMCCASKCDIVQLHFCVSNKLLYWLKNQLAKNNLDIEIISVFQANLFNLNDSHSIIQNTDYILFDSSLRGGTGIASSDDVLARLSALALDKPIFIAGGLSPSNVSHAVQILRPFAVDVQSGVEYKDSTRKHEKDPLLVEAFVKAVRKTNT